MEIDADELSERAKQLLTSRTFLVAVTLFVAAFAVRWMFHQHGFWIDEGRALLVAENFLNGNGFRFGPGDIMWKHPFVFYTLIAFSYLFFGVTALAGMVTTNVLASLTVVFVFLAGREIFNEWAGVAAAVFMLFNPVHMFYSTRVLTDAPVTFFVTLALYFWARTENRGENWSFYATFVSAGFAILTKLTGIVVLPALFIYYLWKERERLFFKRRYWYGAGIVTGMYGLWEVRNLLTVKFLGIVNVFFGKWLDTGLGGGASGGKGFLEGGVFHLVQLPNTLGVPVLLLFIAGLAFAYVYTDDRMAIPLIYMAAAFFVLSTKGLNRYFMPFLPMAVVVAGYGTDRFRELAASQEERAGHVVFALILLVSAFFLFQGGSAMISSSAQGFTGLEEAGKWIKSVSEEDAAVIAGSGHQIRFFSGRNTIHAGTIDSQEEFYRILTEQNVQYVVVDRWERTQPQWFVQIVQQSDAFQPVRGFGPKDRPSVMVYRVNRSLIG